MKVEVAVLGSSLSPTDEPRTSTSSFTQLLSCVVQVQRFFTSTVTIRTIKDESPGRPPRLSHSPYGPCGRKAALYCTGTGSDFSSCVKVSVVVLDSPSLIVRTVSVEVKQHLKKEGEPQSSGVA